MNIREDIYCLHYNIKDRTGHDKVRVFCNGILVNGCCSFSVKEGWAVFVCVDHYGDIVLNGDAIMKDIVRGTITYEAIDV